MTTQKSITSYFCASKFTKKEMEKAPAVKRKLSLNRGGVTPKLEPAGVVEISSDDDDSEQFRSPPSPASTLVLTHLSQSSLEDGMSSDSSSQTILYTYSPKSLKKCIQSQYSPKSSNAQCSPEKSPKNSIKSEPITSPGPSMSGSNKQLSSPEINSCANTPKLPSTPSPHSSKANVNQSPKWSQKQWTPSSSLNKFFSPSKKRNVSKRTPDKTRRNLSDFFKSCIPEEDETYLKACEGQDDKSKFIHTYINVLSQLIPKKQVYSLSFNQV